MIIVDLIYNLAILIAACVLAGFIDNRWSRATKTGLTIQGFLFGGAAIIAMLNAFELTPGIIFDGRSVVLSLCALFFGPVSGAIAAIMAIALRLHLGGVGTLMGVLTITASFLLGVIWYYYRRKHNISVKPVYLWKFGLVVHLAMILFMVALPSEMLLVTLSTLGLTILIIYPIATVLGGKILKDQEDNVNLLRDLTEREKQYKSLVNEMKQGLSVLKVLYDAKGLPSDYEFLLVNPNYEKLTRLKQKEITGKTIQEIFPSTEEFYSDKFERVAITGQPEYYENYSSSLKRNFQVTVYRPSLQQLAVILDDITERKEFEAKLVKAKEQAEAGDRLKTAFMNNISHEIRTPLNGILGFGQLINKPNLTNAERESYSDMLQNSVDRLISTVSDYMDISLIASDNLKVSNKSFDLNLFVTELFNQLQLHCAARKLEAKLLVPEKAEPIQLATDKELMRKAFGHLLNNAVKFTDSGYVLFGYSMEPGYLQFFVQDTGIGIRQEYNSRIFDPFDQEENTNTRQYEGSGLGLPIAKGIIEKLGGRIWFESKKGVGSKFYVKFPFIYNLQESASHETLRKPVSGTGSPLVLVAEDDDSSFMYLDIILKREKLNVIRARDGQEAVDFCRQHKEISVVLMDVKMPVLDGLEATQMIKSFRSDLPIIGVTAYALSGDESRALKVGFDDYLSKPLKMNTLVLTLKKLGIIK